MTPAVLVLLGIVLGTGLGWVLGRGDRHALAHRGYMRGWRDAAQHFEEEHAYGYDEGYRDALAAQKARTNGYATHL